MGLNGIRESVIENGGVKTVTVAELRIAIGKGKMGTHVAQEIKENLGKLNLGHYPENIPTSQNENVLLFDKSNHVNKIIHAVIDPSPDTDHILTNLQGGSSQLQQVRDLVDQLLGN